jgi:hypothetical protein
MYFGMKSYLKNTRNHTANQTLNFHEFTFLTFNFIF